MCVCVECVCGGVFFLIIALMPQSTLQIVLIEVHYVAPRGLEVMESRSHELEEQYLGTLGTSKGRKRVEGFPVC